VSHALKKSTHSDTEDQNGVWANSATNTGLSKGHCILTLCLLNSLYLLLTHSEPSPPPIHSSLAKMSFNGRMFFRLFSLFAHSRSCSWCPPFPCIHVTFLTRPKTDTESSSKIRNSPPRLHSITLHKAVILEYKILSTTLHFTYSSVLNKKIVHHH
jgi:hypothetical protein